MNGELKLGKRALLLYGVLPALLTGVLSFLPTLYQEWKQPRASLSYEAAIGPRVATPDGNLRIGNVSIRNAGTRALTGVRIRVGVATGTVQSITFAENQLIELEARIESGDAMVSVKSLLPGEKLAATYLVKSENASELPVINVRSNEVVGSPPVVESPYRELRSGLASAVIAGFVVFVTVVGWYRILIRKLPSTAAGEKQAFIRYVAIRAGVHGFAGRPEVVGENLSYVRASDVFLSVAQESPQLRSACVLAMQSLLLVTNMAEDSRALIVRNVEWLQQHGSFENEARLLQEGGARLSKATDLRMRVDEFIDNPALFFVSGALAKPSAVT